MGCRIRARPIVRIGVEPPPNYERELQARWNAYFRMPDPDALKGTPEDAAFDQADEVAAEPLEYSARPAGIKLEADGAARRR